MAQPINYMLQNANPVEAIQQGMTFAQNQKLEAQKLAMLKQQQEQQAKQQEAFNSLLSNPNPTVQDYANVAMMMPKEQSESIRASWDMLNDDQKQNTLNFSTQTLAAFQSGANDVGIELLRERAEAERNSGNEAGAKAYDTWARLAEISPDQAYKSMGAMVAALPEGKDALSAMGLDKSQVGMGTLNPSDYTPESYAKYKDTGDLAVLKRYKDPFQARKLSIQEENLELSRLKQEAKAATDEITRAEKEQNVRKKELEIQGKEREMVESADMSVSNTQRALDVANDVLENVDLEAITGLSSLTPTIMPETQDQLNRIMQLKDLLTIDNLKLMSGVLTDRDIQVLSSAGSGLIIDEGGVKGSEKGVRDQLNIIKRILQKNYDKALQKANEVKKTVQVPNERTEEPQATKEAEQTQQEYTEGTVIENPATGQKLILRNNQWVNM